MSCNRKFDPGGLDLAHAPITHGDSNALLSQLFDHRSGPRDDLEILVQALHLREIRRGEHVPAVFQAVLMEAWKVLISENCLQDIEIPPPLTSTTCCLFSHSQYDII